MGDLTYDPNEPRRPRPIASPFGVVPTPGFNVVDPRADQGPSLMDNLWASLPTRQDLKQGTAETLGAPVDMLGWLAHRMGLAVPGGAVASLSSRPKPTRQEAIAPAQG